MQGLVRIAALGALAALLGCEEGSSSTAAPAPTPVSREASPSATPTGTAPAVPKSPHAGTWKARFQTQRGEVEVPKGVPYDPWITDDGSAAAGKGEISIVVGPDGGVSGDGAGALGALAIRGRLEDGELRAGVTPVDPGQPEAMTGVLTAALKDGKLEGDLRVSNPDGRVVRTAVISLERLD